MMIIQKHVTQTPPISVTGNSKDSLLEGVCVVVVGGGGGLIVIRISILRKQQLPLGCATERRPGVLSLSKVNCSPDGPTIASVTKLSAHSPSASFKPACYVQSDMSSLSPLYTDPLVCPDKEVCLIQDPSAPVFCLVHVPGAFTTPPRHFIATGEPFSRVSPAPPPTSTMAPGEVWPSKRCQ